MAGHTTRQTYEATTAGAGETKGRAGKSAEGDCQTKAAILGFTGNSAAANSQRFKPNLLMR